VYAHFNVSLCLVYKKDKIRWAEYLEDYEILFPETINCRQELLGIQHDIDEYVGKLFTAFGIVLAHLSLHLQHYKTTR